MTVEQINDLRMKALIHGDTEAINALAKWATLAHDALLLALKRTRAVKTDYAKLLKELTK